MASTDASATGGSIVFIAACSPSATPRLTQEGREMAAVLACGPGAVVSHWTAAVRWALLRHSGRVVHIVRRGAIRRHPGILVHRVSHVHPHEWTRRDGIPITSVARTLFDLASVATQRQLARAINEADRQGRLNRRALGQVCERNRGRRGVKTLRSALSHAHPQAARTRSELEVAFLAFCRAHRLPSPTPNAVVEGYEVDMYWPGTTVIVELDGFEYHRTRSEFERDHERDMALKAAGCEVLRVTARQLTKDPRELAAVVRRLLPSRAESPRAGTSARARARSAAPGRSGP